MNKIQLFLFIISCFGKLIKEVKYNRFISDFWTVELLKDGISLRLQIFNDNVLPILNLKNQSVLNYDEVFPYIIGLFNLQSNINIHQPVYGGNNEKVNRSSLNVS